MAELLLMLFSVGTQTRSHTSTHSRTHSRTHCRTHSRTQSFSQPFNVQRLRIRHFAGVAFAYTSPKVDALNLTSSSCILLTSAWLRISQFICCAMATCGPGEMQIQLARANWPKLLAKVRQLCACVCANFVFA